MNFESPAIYGRPIALTQSTEAQVYGLFALAMGLTVIGVYTASQLAVTVMSTGVHFFFLIAELALILTARFWVDKSPLNYLLFGLFPFLSGFTITPYLMMVLAQYANGASILLNALGATACMF